MQPEHRRLGEDTPPTPVPVVMRLAQEIAAVSLDLDASLAQVYRSEDGSDPLRAIIDPSGLDDESVVQPNDTVTVRTGEPEPYDESIAQPAGGDTVTVRTGEPDMFDGPVDASGDTVTTPWAGTPPMSAETVTQRPDTAVDDTTTVRADRGSVITNLGVGAPAQTRALEQAASRTSPGWKAPPTGASPGSPMASSARSASTTASSSVESELVDTELVGLIGDLADAADQKVAPRAQAAPVQRPSQDKRVDKDDDRKRPTATLLTPLSERKRNKVAATHQVRNPSLSKRIWLLASIVMLILAAALAVALMNAR
jgi:hypothetical protein